MFRKLFHFVCSKSDSIKSAAIKWRLARFPAASARSGFASNGQIRERWHILDTICLCGNDISLKDKLVENLADSLSAAASQICGTASLHRSVYTEKLTAALSRSKFTMHMVFETMLEVCVGKKTEIYGGNREQLGRVASAGLAIALSLFANEQWKDARELLEKIITYGRFKRADFSKLLAKAADGTIVMFSKHGVSGNNVNIATIKPDGSIIIHGGYFSGTPEEFIRKSEETRDNKSEYNSHCRDFVAAVKKVCEYNIVKARPGEIAAKVPAIEKAAYKQVTYLLQKRQKAASVAVNGRT